MQNHALKQKKIFPLPLNIVKIKVVFFNLNFSPKKLPLSDDKHPDFTNRHTKDIDKNIAEF